MARTIAACIVLGFLLVGVNLSAQSRGTIRFLVMLVDSDLNIKPVPRHVLIIRSSRSSEAVRVVTSLDGKAEVLIDPGDYVIESERAVDFQGKSYRWSRRVTVRPSETLNLEFSIDNATIDALPQTPKQAADLPSLFKQWQNSVVTVWGETGRGTGFLIDSRGLVATNQHVVSNFEYATVQLDEKTKVSARIVARSSEKDIAILWIAATRARDIQPVVLAYAMNGKAPVTEGEQVFTIGSPLHQRKVMTAGIVSKVEPRAIISDVNINHGNSGGPLFTMDARVVGVTTFGDLSDQGGPGISGIVRIDEARGLIAEAQKVVSSAEPPSDALLPVEPNQPFPVDALKEMLQARQIKASDYAMGAGGFDLMFITPVLTHGVRYAAEQANLKEKSKRNQKPAAASETINPLSATSPRFE